MTGSPFKWSTTASANANADPDINWSEGQSPSSVNDSARALMAGVKNLLNDVGGALLAGGTADALTLTLGQSLPTLAAGIYGRFRASAVNLTTSPTLAVNGGTALAMRKNSVSGLVAMAAGDLQIGNHYTFTYDASGPYWIIGGSASAAGASFASGAAYDAEVSVAAAGTCSIFAAASYFIAITGSTTITSFGTGANKIRYVRFTGAPLITHNSTSLICPGGASIQAAAGDTAIIETDGSSNARILSYQKASGLDILTVTAQLDTIGNTRGQLLYRGASAWLPLAPGTSGQFLKTNGAGADPSWSPDNTGLFSTLYESAQQTITSGGALTLTHGLSAQPKLVLAVLQCTTADAGYSIGDEFMINTGVVSAGSSLSQGVSVVPDATNLNCRYGNAGIVFAGLNKTTGAGVNFTNTSWKLVLRAWI